MRATGRAGGVLRSPRSTRRVPSQAPSPRFAPSALPDAGSCEAQRLRARRRPCLGRQSIGSFYDLVDRIVVSYDRRVGRGRGIRCRREESLDRLVAADPDGKILMLPRAHSDPDRFVLDVETEHRQSALDAASEGADWVIQLDTDEVLPSPSAFTAQLTLAEQRGADALEFPARIIYARTPSGRFLEQCGRLWTPVGVPRAGGRSSGNTTHARTTGGGITDVSCRRGAMEHRPAHPSTARVHRVIARPTRSCI